jgi:hypothetical protein
MGVTADSHTERLGYLTANVLSLDDNGHPLQGDDVWRRIFSPAIESSRMCQGRCCRIWGCIKIIAQ